MAREGNVGWVQPAGNTGPQIYITTKGGGIDFVGRITPGVTPRPNEAELQDQGFYTTIDGVQSNRYRIYSTLPPTAAPPPPPSPAPPPYTPATNPPQRLKVIRCNGTGGYKHLSVNPFGNYSNGMSIRFGSPYPSGYCYTIIDQDTTGSLVDGTNISVISAYLTCTSCNSALPALSGTTSATCLDNGGQNGRITVTPSGGTGVYYFKLNGAGSYGIAGDAATNADGLADNTYAITLYDDGGNTATLTSRTLNCYIQPDGTVNTSCTATNNAGGKITVTSPSGGTGVYYFKVNDGATQYATGAGGGVTGLADGNYNIKIYDSIGNVRDKGNFAIACYDAPTGTASYTCIDYTATNARIDVTGVTGGTGAGYYFTLNGSGTYTVGAGNGPTGLANGTYAVVLHDNYGSRSLGNVVVDCADCTISGGTASQVPAPTPAPAPAAPTPAPAAPTPAPAAPTPAPAAPTPAPAAPPPVSSLDWDCVMGTCTNVGTGLGIYADYTECINSGCEGTPPSPTPAPAPTPAAPPPQPAAPPPSPEAPPAAPSPTPEAPTPAPAPTPNAPSLDWACESYICGPTTPGTGTFASYEACIASGCEEGAPSPTPAPAPTPTPTPAPAPTPTPAAPTYDVYVADEYGCAQGCTQTNTGVLVAFASGTSVTYYTKHYKSLGGSNVGYNYVITGTSSGAGLILDGTQYASCTAACTAEGEPVGPPPPPPPSPAPSPAAASYTLIYTGLRRSTGVLACDVALIEMTSPFYVDGTSLSDSNYMALNGDGTGTPTNGWYSDSIVARECTGGVLGGTVVCSPV